MLSEIKLKNLTSEIKSYSREELVWFNGYLSGILSVEDIGLSPTQQVTSVTEVKIKPTIIYGTETGNSKKLASQLQALLKKNKIQAKTVDVAQYPLDKIEKEEFIISIMSTQGEGEPPLNAVHFFELLSSKSINLTKTQFAVLALGDSSYPLFCKAGQDLDELLVKLGGKRVLPLQKTDVDYEETANVWFKEVFQVLQTVGLNSVISPNIKVEQQIATKKNYEGIVKHKVVLNDRGSNKETYHIELELNESVVFEPGDAIGLYPKNKTKEIQELASLLKAEDRFAELENKNVKGLTAKSITNIAKLFHTEIEEEKLDLIDLLEKYPAPETVDFDQVLNLLHPIAPRLYSISSSPDAHEGEVHITVNLSTFEAQGKHKTGLCSQYLANFENGQKISFYVHKNQHFRLPEDDKNIIMIGPGTGIAPFRSFLAHRDANGAEGKNWLFFGEQHFVTDFYYQTEIQEWLTTGVLTKLDTAFSRDQKHKIYVQDRLQQNAEQIFEWLESGAYLYLCGQKVPMSTDVENTLIEIIANSKNTSVSEAKNYLEKLELEGRYQKDVY